MCDEPGINLPRESHSTVLLYPPRLQVTALAVHSFCTDGTQLLSLNVLSQRLHSHLKVYFVCLGPFISFMILQLLYS